MHTEEAAEVEARLSGAIHHRAARDREFGAVDLLAAKQIGDGFNRQLLVVKVGFEMQFHARTSPISDMFLSWRF